MKVTFALRAAAVAAAMTAGSAYAAPITLQNLDGPFVGFTEFDYSSSGQAYITDYNVLNTTPTGTVDQFRLQFQATASGIKVNGLDVPSAMTPGLNTTYEYSIYADIIETVSCLGGANGCDVAALNLVSGTWAIYYDTNAATFANYAAGTGFTNGDLLLSGTFSSSTTVLAAQGSSNPGNQSLLASLFGTVMIQNTTFINPMLSGTTATSTLQFGNTVQQGWVAPAAFNGNPVGAPNNTQFLAQADANQSFVTASIPEPASLALVGLALGAAGYATRRRQQAK